MLKGHERARDQLSVKRILTDDSIMITLLGSFIMAVVYYNAESCTMIIHRTSVAERVGFQRVT